MSNGSNEALSFITKINSNLIVQHVFKLQRSPVALPGWSVLISVLHYVHRITQTKTGVFVVVMFGAIRLKFSPKKNCLPGSNY